MAFGYSGQLLSGIAERKSNAMSVVQYNSSKEMGEGQRVMTSQGAEEQKLRKGAKKCFFFFFF